MARFKQVPHHYLLGKLMEYWRNIVRNYNGDVRDSDFFDIVSNRCPHERALKLIKGVYSRNELMGMEKSRSRLCRLNLSDGLESIFQSLWNHKGTRAKCKAVLEGVYDCIVKGNGRRTGRPEAIEERFAEIKRLLKLSDLEKEILILSYVKARTCFDWPVRIDNPEKPLYYAMALDRSYAEVSKTMTANGRLRKFGLLDSDWDFNWRVLDGYMDGSDSEALERRFYRKCGEGEELPWNFFGDLAAKDGAVIKEMVKAARGRCNILLYGAPGTGKTSFARTLAKELGLTAMKTGIDPDLSAEELADLILERPETAEQRGRDDWLKLTGDEWARLLSEQPQLAGKCHWHKFSAGNWAELIGNQPQFADKCDWTRLANEQIGELLKAHPSLADQMPMMKYIDFIDSPTVRDYLRTLPPLPPAQQCILIAQSDIKPLEEKLAALQKIRDTTPPEDFARGCWTFQSDDPFPVILGRYIKTREERLAEIRKAEPGIVYVVKSSYRGSYGMPHSTFDAALASVEELEDDEYPPSIQRLRIDDPKGAYLVAELSRKLEIVEIDIEGGPNAENMDIWGGGWRMPTHDELDELVDNCDWAWTKVNDVEGYVVRGRGDYASASIFLPAAGQGYGAELGGVGTYGGCWASDPGYESWDDSWDLSFWSSRPRTGTGVWRYIGLSVRPVQGFTK